MLFTTVLLSALAATSGAFAKNHTNSCHANPSHTNSRHMARQNEPTGDEVVMSLVLTTGGGALSFTLNASNFPQTVAAPAGDFDTVFFSSGPDVDPALRCRIFYRIETDIPDTIVVDRGTNLERNSFSKGNPWTFSNGLVSPVAAVQCGVEESLFFGSPA